MKSCAIHFVGPDGASPIVMFALSVASWPEKCEPGPLVVADSERVVRLLRDNGYKLPPHLMNARFIHYLDQTMRKELMIIFSEDLAPTGYTSEQLMDGNAPIAAWTPIAEALIQRAKAAITLTRLEAAK